MKILACIALVGAFAFATAAFAADPPKSTTTAAAPAKTAATDAKPLTPQQERMKTCNANATGKTGDDRKKYMSACLSGEAPAKMTQQDKMKSCNTKAGPMKGDERKKFMSSCLSA